MIVWLTSYPKSGNTWMRAIISSLFFTKDGVFNFDLLKNILDFDIKERYEFVRSINSDDFNKLFEVKGGELPKIVLYTLQHKISIESFIILNEMLNFIPKVDNECGDYYWPTFKTKCFKYRPFLKINTAQYQEICRTILRRN